MSEFTSPTYGRIELKEVLEKIATKVTSKPDAEWILAIGTDSQNKGNKTSFCSTILLLEKGKGGIYFYNREDKNRIPEVRFRMLTEAEMSINLSKEVISAFEDMYLNEIFDFYDYDLVLEIHCDLGNNGKSCEAISAAIGWITAEFGGKVVPKIKPESPAASCVADKYTK